MPFFPALAILVMVLIVVVMQTLLKELNSDLLTWEVKFLQTDFLGLFILKGL